MGKNKNKKRNKHNKKRDDICRSDFGRLARIARKQLEQQKAFFDIYDKAYQSGRDAFLEEKGEQEDK